MRQTTATAQIPSTVEVPLELRNMLLVAVEVSAMHVESAYERGEESAGLRAALIGGNMIDIKEHALGGVPLLRDLNSGAQ